MPKMKPSFSKLRAATAHFGSGLGVPYISDGDSARVLLFFNLSGAYDGNTRHEEAKQDAAYIAATVNVHQNLINTLRDIALRFDGANHPGSVEFRTHAEAMAALRAAGEEP